MSELTHMVEETDPSLAVDDGALVLRTLTSLDELRALGLVWNEVHGAAMTRSPFLTHEFVVTWWESFGAGELSVIVFEDEHGVAGIAPLALSRRGIGPFSYRALEVIGTGPLRFLGMGLADRADLIIARRAEDCLVGLVRWLASTRASWDVLDLRFLPVESATSGRLPELARRAGLGSIAEPCAESPYLALHGTYQDYLQRRSRNFRKGLKRKLSKLEERGEVSFELAAESTMPVLEAFSQVVATSHRSWKEAAGSALFMHPRVRTFYERLLPRLATRDGVYIALCRVDGKVVAHEFGYRLDRKLWSYDSGFDRAHGEGSPGNLLTARLLERAWADGLVEYDFMRGNEGYKLSWQTEVRFEQQLVVDAGTARGKLARRVAFEGVWALKRRPAIVALQMRLAGIVNRLLVGDKASRGDA